MQNNSNSNSNRYHRLFATLFSGLILMMISLDANVYALGQRADSIKKSETARDKVVPSTPEECVDFYKICSTSIARLLSTPQKYHNRKVLVKGLFILSTESSGLYDENTRGEVLHSMGIWINGDIPKSLNLQAISLTGTFRRGPTGHMNEFGAQLDNIEIVKTTR